MSLPTDLLDQAEHLAHLDPRKPKQANVRRGISSAYYALFHYLVQEAAERVIPGDPDGLQMQARRFASHAGMKKICESISKNNLSPSMRRLLPVAFGPEIVQVAKAFVDLQEARHRADYDIGTPHTPGRCRVVDHGVPKSLRILSNRQART